MSRETFTDTSVADRWVAWLREEHIADVMKAGAIGATIVRVDGDNIRYDIRYVFDSRDEFEVYERDHAPRLREEGLARFPLSLGLSYTRAAGEIVGSFART